jgi:hypothetical protein
MENFYNVEELYTTGWVVIHENLTKPQAAEKLEELMREGVSPDLLRATKV